MKIYSLTVILYLGFALYSNAQDITGRVIDSKSLEALPFANAFLNNTTAGAVTDNKGEFIITSINEPGVYELIISFVGYETYKTKITIGNSTVNVGTIKLISFETQLNVVEVTSTRDKEWERKLKKFKKVFLGDDKLAASCTILNPWVIDFPKHDSKFIATAAAPIEIENNAMGYKINFYLTNFWSDANEYSIAGNAHFTELKSDETQKVSFWENNRNKSYRQSTHHLFKSIIEQRIYGEGFSLYGDKENSKNSITRSSLFYADVGKSVFAYDTSGLVVADAKPGYYKITLKGRVEVHDRKEKATKRIYEDVFGLVSWVTLKNNQVIVNQSGIPKNPSDVIVAGDMSSGRVASMLPLDYKPQKAIDQMFETTAKIDYRKYYEQIYIHTDKPYYYPGETIWFKGYMNYANPALKDSLSKTVYVEVVDRKLQKIILSKILRIENGFFNNEFQLPDTLAPKMYYLRAYTNFNRNFGDQNLYRKPLPVLSLTDRQNSVNASLKKELNDRFEIIADKKYYKPREKITLTLMLKDDDDKPVSANLSLSVVDSAKVVPMMTSGTILDDYPLKESESYSVIKDMPFSIEYGINFSGKFMNDANKPEKASLNILQLNPNNFTMAQSDNDGLFSVSGFSFYDTATFSVQTTTSKGEAYGHGEWIKSKAAGINFKEGEYQFDLIKTEFPQRVLSEYENPPEARILKEVVIKSTKVQDQADYRLKRPYGKPDYVLKAKDLNTGYGNLLQALPGKVPGLTVRQAFNDGEESRWVVYIERGGKNSSILFPKEVTVLINDVLANGTPEQILSAIDPATVESVEIKTGVNVLYGSNGGNGILTVYTKREFEQKSSTKSLSMMKVPGYSRSHNFRAPDYSNPQTDNIKADYRSTIYWNPIILTDAKTGTATVSFFAADLPGKYRIVAEGVLPNGEAVRCVNYIEIGSSH